MENISQWVGLKPKEVNQEIEQLNQNNQSSLDKINLVKTVPGIGPVISTTLVADLPELGQLTAKQISRLVGTAHQVRSCHHLRRFSRRNGCPSACLGNSQ